MATPVAHACAGLACLALVRAASPARLPQPSLGQALTCVFAACMPDLDIAASLVLAGNPTALHSGATHSFGFVAVVSGITWIALRGHDAREALALAVTLAVASHVVIDFFTGPTLGGSPSFGVPALWPLTGQRLNAPITLFRGVKHGSVAMWFNAHNLTTAALELLFAAPLTRWSLLILRRPLAPNSRTCGLGVVRQHLQD